MYPFNCLLTEQQHLDFVAHLHAVTAKLVLNIFISATALLIFLADAATHGVCVFFKGGEGLGECRVWKLRENDGLFGRR